MKLVAPSFRSIVWLVTLLALLSTEPLAAQPILDTDWTPTQMMRVKRIGGVQVSPDGKRVVYAVRSAILRGARASICRTCISSTPTAPAPSNSRKATNRATIRNGRPTANGSRSHPWRSGKRNLWLVPAAGGESHQLTDIKTAVTSFKWSPDSELDRLHRDGRPYRRRGQSEEREKRCPRRGREHQDEPALRRAGGRRTSRLARVLTTGQFSVERRRARRL